MKVNVAILGARQTTTPLQPPILCVDIYKPLKQHSQKCDVKIGLEQKIVFVEVRFCVTLEVAMFLHSF